MHRPTSVTVFALALAAAAAPSPGRADPPPVENYGKLPAMEMVKLSPSGDRYAFVADDGQARKIFVATTDNKPIQVVPLGKVKVQDLDWAGDDYILVHWSATVDTPDFTVTKQELGAATVLNLKTGKVIQVFADRGEVDHVVFGFYGTALIAGRWYGYFSGLSMDADHYSASPYSNVQHEGATDLYVPDLQRVDLESGVVKKVAVAGIPDTDWLVSRSGDIIARTEYFEQSGSWKLYTRGFGGQLLASGSDKSGPPSLMGLDQAGGGVLVDVQTEDGVATEDFPLAGGAPKQVISAQSPDVPLTSPSTKLWIGTFTDGDEPTENLLDPVAEARVKGARKAFPGYRVRLTSWSDDFSRMIVFTDGGDDSGTYWIVDIAKKSADVLGQAYPTVNPSDVGPTRMVDFTAADGLALRGVLTLPPGRNAKNLPLVVMPHGGPWARDYPGFDYWAQAFASRGYAVFQPNFRGSTGSGDKVYNAGRGEWGRKMQTDISDGVAELARQGIADPKRACIVGWSYGGYAALAGVTVQHGLYRCAVSMAGVSDLTAQLRYTEDEAGDDSPAARQWKSFLGVSSNGSAPNAISPIKLADKADAPVLLIHGKDDTVVKISQSDAMESALKAAGKPVERLTLVGGDHPLNLQDTRMSMLKASVAFVEKYDPPDPPPTAVAAASH
jgi:dienelactone hydrolase